LSGRRTAADGASQRELGGGDPFPRESWAAATLDRTGLGGDDPFPRESWAAAMLDRTGLGGGDLP
jgi:hypothetical protein